MQNKNLQEMYKTIIEDPFPPSMEIHFVDKNQRKVLVYEKVTWNIEGEIKGLRYGENPDQPAAFYKLINGNLVLGKVETIKPGKYLVSDIELLQSGKHPGKINITDVDNGLNILRYLMDKPTCIILKHNNPCGAASGRTLAEAYYRANAADRIAAFGGAVVVNRPVDIETAKLISENYVEVIAAPEYEEGVMDIFSKKSNMRVMLIRNIQKLKEFENERFVDFKSLMDGGIIAQISFIPRARKPEDLIPAFAVYQGVEYRINRLPTEKEYTDLIFGWMIEAGVTSNSIIYVKDESTLAVGTGEQDRVGVAIIARDKAYRNACERLAWEKHHKNFASLKKKEQKEIEDEVKARNGELKGSSMISDGFFPFRDTVDVAAKEGISAILQPGGSLRDHESIQACNEAGIAMVFTGQRSFKH